MVSDARPLADKRRPKTLEEFVGQSHVRSRIENLMGAKRLPSLLFFGPPGCGKSTLAILLAKAAGRPFLRVSAPEAGLAKLRAKLPGHDILILDELHRFSKAQQDFFLPILESGETTLLATTTENPSFSVTKQLLSRLHVLRLRLLSHDELLMIADRCLKELSAELPRESLDIMAAMASGDGRAMLNLVEFAVSLPEDKRTAEDIRAALPEAMVRGDRDGDSHYELASAFIKSIRGSDPDAALYYLACMLEGGEDPRFVCRRLMISASEDVGLADPMALPLTVSCAEAVDRIGMPEGFIPLAETTVYLALAPKSNTAYAAYLNAKKDIARDGVKPVPLHLRNPSTRLQKEWGFGKGYKYPHSYPDAYVDQVHLPDELVGRRYYQAKDQGYEPRLAARLARLRKKGR